MKFDLVHDIQSAYRKVIDSISRPGLISTLKEEAAMLEFHTGCFPSTEVLALMLLDIEVTFKVVSKREEKITGMLNQITYAKAVEANEADFIFILKDYDRNQLETAIRSAKSGSLVNPNESAILIIETGSVSMGTDLVMTGPGIETEQVASIDGADTWLDIRAEKNKEYPLGIDTILTDTSHSILCLPRSTQIKKRVTV